MAQALLQAQKSAHLLALDQFDTQSWITQA